MQLRKRIPLLIAMVAATLVLGALATATAAPQGAATSLTFGRDSCLANGRVTGDLSWTPSRQGEQYVELATNSNFAGHNTGGPYASSASRATLTELSPGTTYYTRVRTIVGGQALYSDPLTVTPGSCGVAVAPTAPATQASGSINLINAHSNRCLEIYSVSRNDFASAVQWGCWGGSNQTIQAVQQADGYFLLRFAHSGKCLEVLNWRTDNGAAIGQYACHGGDNQRWAGNLANGSVSVLRNKFSNKCLDVYGWSTRDGDVVVQWDCHLGNNQQWRTQATAAPAPSPNPTGAVIALTIDTDDIRGVAPQVLDVLDAYGVKASFGVTGIFATNNPDLVQRMVASGHTVMNHSWNHPAFANIGTAERQNQLQWAENAINQAAGITTRPYFRPPYGSTNASVAADVGAVGYRVILWHIDPQGWRGYSGEQISSHIISRAFNGAIVLLHSTNQGDLAALGPTITALRAQGYSFVTMAQLSPP